jgi:hypothetical protein
MADDSYFNNLQNYVGQEDPVGLYGPDETPSAVISLDDTYAPSPMEMLAHALEILDTSSKDLVSDDVNERTNALLDVGDLMLAARAVLEAARSWSPSRPDGHG